MKKRNIRLCAVLLAMLLLAGCVRQPPNQTDSTQMTQSDPTQATQTHPTEPVTLPTETVPTEPPTEPTEPPTEPTEPPPSLDPVSYLGCTRFRTFPELLSLGNGLVLASRNYYAPGAGYVNSMEIIDVYADTVVAKLSNDSTLEPVLQRFDDDTIVMADPKTRTFHVYDQELTLQSSFTAPNMDGFFSHDRANYYYVEDDLLWRMDVASGNAGTIAVEHGMHIESLLSIHHSQDLLVARIFLSDHSTNCGIAVIDARTGGLRLLRSALSQVWLSNDLFYGVDMNAEKYGYDLYYGDLAGGNIQRIGADVLNGEIMGYSVLPQSHYLVRRLAPDTGPRATSIFDLSNGGAMADMGKYGFNDAVLHSIYLAEEQLIFGLYAKGYDFDIILIDPKVLEFEKNLTPEAASWQDPVDQNAVNTYLDEVNGPALPGLLDSLRDQADRMQTKYGVEILMSNQVWQHTGYSFETSENPAQIKAALEQLDAALAMYPANLWKQLRNSAGEGGLSISLTGTIEGELPTAGLTRPCRSRYELILDISGDALTKTIHHELWHAIELHLSSDVFNTTQWMGCNPEGFTYYGKYDNGYTQLTRWTHSGGSGENSHFTDPYARINGREDRARIMEWVMTGSGEELANAPALKAKLALMAAAIRTGFNTNGWTDVYWEQYL